VIQVRLTYPPSANRIWRNVKGKTLKSAEYRAWLEENQLRCKAPAEPFAGIYRLVLQAHAPDKRARDLDNTIKPASDFLQLAGFVTNDSNMKAIEAAWVDLLSPGLMLFIEPMGAR
jgi:Holliday junction resolvase RusA-like endonuclease